MGSSSPFSGFLFLPSAVSACAPLLSKPYVSRRAPFVLLPSLISPTAPSSLFLRLRCLCLLFFVRLHCPAPQWFVSSSIGVEGAFLRWPLGCKPIQRCRAFTQPSNPSLGYVSSFFIGSDLKFFFLKIPQDNGAATIFLTSEFLSPLLFHLSPKELIPKIFFLRQPLLSS